MTVADVAAGRANNFDALRLLAAAAVLVSHAYVLTGRPEPLVGRHSWGALGVTVFFAISGFLICRSWWHQPRIGAFALKRALRIVPALLAVLLASAYLLGPVASALTPGNYLAGDEAAWYVLGNLAAVATGGVAAGVEYELPGVFAGNPHADVVNGSLWTLPVEVEAYLLVALLGAAGVLFRALPAVALGGLAVTAALGAGVDVPFAGARPESVHLLTIFAVGGLLWAWRAALPLRLDAAAAALAAWVVGLGSPVEGVITAIAIPYLVLAAAYRSPAAVRGLTRRGDVSYGLYLLAFPVQQCIVAGWGAGAPSPMALVAVSLPATYLLAALSWRYVEAPALALKGAAGRPPAPAVTPVRRAAG